MSAGVPVRAYHKILGNGKEIRMNCVHMDELRTGLEARLLVIEAGKFPMRMHSY